MNLVDILIWVILLVFAVKGFMKGLVREVCSLLGLFVGMWAAFAWYRSAAELLMSHIHLPGYVASFVSFTLIFFAFALLFVFLGHLLTSLFKIILLGGLNRLGGVVIGVLQAVVILCLMLAAGTTTVMPATVKDQVSESVSARPLTACGRLVWSWWKSGKDSEEEAEPDKVSTRSPMERDHAGKTR